MSLPQLRHRYQLRTLFGVATVLIGFSVLFAAWGGPALAADTTADRSRLTDLQKKAQELNSQIQANSQAAAQKKKEATSITGQIDRITTDISVTTKKIESTGQQIKSVEQQITDKQREIETKQKELDIQQANQDEALRVLYETSDEDMLFVVAGSDSVSEAVEHQQYLESLEDSIAANIAQIEQLKRELEQQKSELQDRQRELDSLKAQQEAYKAGLANEKEKKDDLLDKTKEQQAAFEDLVNQAKQLNAQVESEMSSIRARLTKASGPGVVQAKDRGTSSVGFQWPTDYRYTSTYFGGSTPFQPNGGHGGIDLVNSAGTPIYAAADGTVTAVQEMMYNGRFYAYGRYIVIGHNARWSSLYAHLQSALVSAGTEVKRGEIIGYMGSTGWSTGPHLHFEIWDSSSRVNPLNYLP